MSRVLGLSSLVVACSVGCTAPTPELVAREQGTPAPQVVTEPGRGRVTVVDGRLLSDLGTPLRGLDLPVDVGWSLDDFGLMSTIAQTSGLNTVHVYLENYAQTTGDMQAAGDALVSLTAQAGLYLVLGIGGGVETATHGGNGSFDIDKVRSFWKHYAPRYAASTHVLFEIQNNPEITCEKPIAPATIAMEREAYGIIRGLAPDSHIVLFSTSAVPRLSVVQQAIDDVSDVVDFSNASFAMHTDISCTAVADLGGVFQAAHERQVPVLISQLPNDGWDKIISSAEGSGVGWLHHRWLSYEPELSTLLTAVTAAKLSWCPDQGNFPEAASGCH